MSDSKINLIGGNAYSSTGGIQAVNRLLVRELGSAGLLRRAYFLWDDPATATPEGFEQAKQGLVRFYSLAHSAFTKDIFCAGVTQPADLWLCTHVNYSLVGLCTSFGRASRVGVLLHAAELDEAFNERKRLALCLAGRVFAVSEFTKKKALALGVKASRIQVLLNGVDDPCPGWQPEHYNLASEVLLFVGRMDERYKGQMELLDAMTLLRERLPDLRLAFVGGGQTLDEWKAEAARRGLSDRVEFTGRISEEELRQRYQSAAIFAMPSENEGFGLVYAEAMAHGVPCIGSDRDAAREVIAHGESGLCVPAGNSTALADAIFSLIRSNQQRSQMSLTARARFLAHFSAGKHRERLLTELKRWQEAVG